MLVMSMAYIEKIFELVIVYMDFSEATHEAIDGEKCGGEYCSNS